VTHARRCLVVHPGALGDVLLARPALAHLRDLGYRTTLAVAPRLVPLFAASGLVDDARDLERLGLSALFEDPPAETGLATLAGYDAVVSWLGAGEPGYRAALGRLGRPTVVARSTPPAGRPCHVSRHLLETLAPLGPVPDGVPPPPALAVSSAERAAALAWLEARGLAADASAVLQAGAGSRAKAWPGFPALAARLRRAGCPLVALAGPADRASIDRLLADGAVAPDRVARDWPLERVAGLLTLARGLVGNDSGPTHLAAAVGCPTVAVFGPTDPLRWAPLGRRVRVVAPGAGGPGWPGVDAVALALAVVAPGPEMPTGATVVADEAGAGGAG
jgi:ADP-heptose:LPS heptosyltransferase